MNVKKIVSMLLIMVYVIVLTSCGNTDNTDESTSEETPDFSQVLLDIKEFNKNIYSTSDESELAIAIASINGRMTDKVYDNHFDLSVPFNASLLIGDGVKSDYSLVDYVIVKDDNSEFYNLYLMFKYTRRYGNIGSDMGEAYVDINCVNKYVINGSMIVNFEFVLSE